MEELVFSKGISYLRVNWMVGWEEGENIGGLGKGLDCKGWLVFYRFFVEKG